MQRQSLPSLARKALAGLVGLTFALWPLGRAPLCPPAQAAEADPGMNFLLARLRPMGTPEGEAMLAMSYARGQQLGAYDNALAALVLLRKGRRLEAGRLLAGLAWLQQEDGGIPFSWSWPAPEKGQRYLRSGAIAWVGCAAVAYLDAEPGGTARVGITAMAHRLATYLLAHQVKTPGDPRDGLVTGGFGRYQYALGPAGPVESFVPEEVPWASVEHNLDAFFFLRGLARVTGEARYRQAADRIAAALLARGWSEGKRQFHQGIGAEGPDPALALDCASWGSLFLAAIGEKARAFQAYASAETRYASADPESFVPGHRPYAQRPVIENLSLARFFRQQVPLNDWERFPAVWAEGSAGVALAAHRLGRSARAKAILDDLEPLRGPDGGLPYLTAAVPLEFETAPSVAGTAWVLLARDEIQKPLSQQSFWTGN